MSSPSVVFRSDILNQDARSPRALFEACSLTLERIDQEVKLELAFVVVDMNAYVFNYFVLIYVFSFFIIYYF